MEKGKRIPLPKILQVYSGDDSIELEYLGELGGLYRFDEYKNGKRLRASTAFTEAQMKQYFGDNF